MNRVTADSNVIISAFNWGGKPARLVDMARHGRIELAVSEPIVNEIARILEGKLKWSSEDVADARRRIARFTTLVSPTEAVDAITADPTDNRILECAVAAGSEVIVSGDRHLLTLASFRGMTVMTVAEFLQRHLKR
ncbi:MAG: putative toxin-antitoxin system toxin component, PIN family [Vicinamibacterales bacterium]